MAFFHVNHATAIYVVIIKRYCTSEYGTTLQLSVCHSRTLSTNKKLNMRKFSWYRQCLGLHRLKRASKIQ